jgi:ornithine--oxo-acid transaminase
MQLLSQRARSLIEAENRHGAHNYHPIDLVVHRAEGVWLWDVDGNRYLDCISAYSAVNQGHCHPRIRAALDEQAAVLTLTSRAMHNDRLAGFLEKLTALCGYDMALPMNTGVEAVETAIKLARRWGYAVKGIPTDAAEIVVFDNNFHGRTVMAVSASTTPEYRRDFGPFVPGFVSIPYGDADALERSMNEKTCIADEIQTGLGRTGDLFACDYDGVKPDILAVGKALGGGFYPVSAALANEPLMRLFGPGDHGSTFGGNPLGCAVATAALDVIVEEKLPARARYAGAKLMQGLRSISSPLVKEIRGRGLLIGVELTIPARRLSDALLERGIAAKDTHERVLRIAPPLVIDDAASDFFLERFGAALAAV